MEERRRRALGDEEPLWTLLAAMVVVAAIVLIWGVDWSGPDRTPPRSQLPVYSAEIPWSGDEVLNLERWTGDSWDRIASAPFRDAEIGDWGRAQSGPQFSQLIEASGLVSMPVDAESGTYRICGIGSEPDCTQFIYERE